jgi:four helix bundle protein
MTSSFPKSEQFGTTAQMRRAANSIGANIAEGCAREGGKDRARFLETSIASAHELEHHLILVADVGLVDAARIVDLIQELEQIRKMITALRLRSLNGPRQNLMSDV